MSRCAHGRPPVNSLRNSAAVIDAGRPAAGIREIGDLALQLIAVFVDERQLPQRDRRRASRDLPHVLDPRSRACRRGPLVHLAQRDDDAPVSVATSTRWVAPSCRAYHSASPRISRPSASVLITSTVLPSALRSTSPGLNARPPGMFSVVGTTPMTRIGRAELAMARMAHGDGGATGHVVLHPLHAFGRLDRDAAGIERDALADQAEDRRRRRLRRLVPEHHQARRLGAAARDAEQQAHAERLDLLLDRALRRRRRLRAPHLRRACANSRGVSALPGSLARSRARLLHSPSMRPRATAPSIRTGSPATSRRMSGRTMVTTRCAAVAPSVL